MPRKPRIDVGGEIYHVINRSNNQEQIFFTDDDYLLFENILNLARKRFDMKILAFSPIYNHFHLSLYPRNDNDVQKFMHWFSMTFAQSYKSRHKTLGRGHLFQDRYKSFIIKDEKHLVALLAYIERNALKAKIVRKAEDWRWSSLWIRQHGTDEQKEMLTDWPIEILKDYLDFLNLL